LDRTGSLPAACSAESSCNSRLQALIEASPLPIISLDPDGVVMSWSRAAERVFGWSEREAIGRPLPCLPGLDPDELRQMQERIRSARPFSNFEAVRRRKDGSVLEVRVSTAPMHDGAGKLLGIVAVYEDVTTQRETEQALRASEEQLRQAQKMEAIGRLAGGVAHDFNNILTAIQGYAEILASELPPGSPLLEDVREIQATSARAGSLTRQLLAFSRKQAVALEPMDLNETVRETDRMLRRIIGEDIELVLQLAPDLGIIRADTGQVGQVLLNLAVNARDAMPTGGRLSIQTRNVELTGRPGEPRLAPGHYVHLIVTDTGVGMDEATRSRVFEPFFTTKEAGKGTGLGLSMVYGFVQQSRGAIAVDSQPGRGTRFKLWWPRHAALPGRGDEPGAVMGAPRAGHGATILLVEDDEGVRSVARRALHRAGYLVLEAENGDSGMRQVAAHGRQVDLVIVDAVMPGMSGPAFAAEYQRLHPEAAVVIMSGYTEDAANRASLLEQCDAFLEKPFSADRLLAVVTRALRNRRAVSPRSTAV
jgi:PAS domain S-box-containing protein